ncbi:hypothetical protein [Bradyrhizobium sp. Leo170]|uniref:hypothetical protein n=2 Tax=unclassified Bradyrhizobium TaxID=2631580 RepID=UPI0013EE411A|nr:hypothetical protein [Bradyrhizobium sp. Leo170]
MNWRAHLASRGTRVKGENANHRLRYLIASLRFNLLKLLGDFSQAEFHCAAKHASLMLDEQ